MRTFKIIIFLFLTLSCRTGPSDKNEFPFLLASETISKVRQFEKNVGSEEVFVETRIYSSDTRPSEFDKNHQPIIFKRTRNLRMPVYVYYFFTPTDSLIYEVNIDWRNLFTEIEKDSTPVDLNSLPTKEDYQNEFNQLTEILSNRFGQYSVRTNYGEIRTWSAERAQLDLYFKDGGREEMLLRLTTKLK